MPEEISLQDVQNILTFMGRADLKGGEAHAYVTAEMKLKMMAQRLKSDAETAGSDTDDGASGD